MIFLDAKGRGFYVGTVLSIVQVEAGWFGEGDDLFYVDGEKSPRIQGTGTEDYFNDAWSFRMARAPYTGSRSRRGRGWARAWARTAGISIDPVPFTKSLRVEIEHNGWTFEQGRRGDAAPSTTAPISSPRSPSGTRWGSRPTSRRRRTAPRASRMGTRRRSRSRSPWPSQGRTGKVDRPEGGLLGEGSPLLRGRGPRLADRCPASTCPRTATTRCSTQVAQAPDYGVYEILLDGKPVTGRELEHEPGADIRTQTRFDGYAYDTYVGLDRQLGWLNLSKGRHSLTFVCIGKNPASSGYTLGVDNVILARTGAKGWSAAASVSEPKLAARDVAGYLRALSDPDPRVRTLAALALEREGAAAAPALGALSAALKDPDPSVREAAARAIGAQGSAAAPAVPALAAACQVPGESGAVVRACLYALGSLGKVAVPALPAIRSALDNPSAGWVAERAIQDIEAAAKK